MKTRFTKSILFGILLLVFAGSRSNAQCLAEFTMANNGGGTVAFTNTSIGFNAFFGSTGQWDFGDGGVGTTAGLAGISHTYANNGLYVICLVMTDSAGCTDNFCDSITINNAGGTCASNFTYTVDTCDVQFADASTSPAGIISWQWSFGDGTGSSLQNPSHTYSSQGPHPVSLTVMATDSCISTFTMNVSTPDCGNPFQNCQVAYSWVHDTAMAYTVLIFPAFIGGQGMTYLWDFGDGNTSNLQYPTHTYAGAGYYNVCVTITDSNCTSTFCDTIGVTYKTNAPFSINVVNTQTSVHQNVAAVDFSVYPNPFDQELNVNFNMTQSGIVSLQLMDVSGRIVYNQNEGNHQEGSFNSKLNPGKLSNGMYLLKITVGDQAFFKKVSVN